jgi:acyl-CoA synthetase (NDP forming)
VGRAILRNIRKAGFKGAFGLVNSHHAEIDGVATVESLAKLPFAPELVVITAPAAAVPGLIDEAGKRGRQASSLSLPGSLTARVHWRMQLNSPRTNTECG